MEDGADGSGSGRKSQIDSLRFPGRVPIGAFYQRWVVAFFTYFLEFSSRSLGKKGSNLTNLHIFQMGWFNHQPAKSFESSEYLKVWSLRSSLMTMFGVQSII